MLPERLISPSKLATHLIIYFGILDHRLHVDAAVQKPGIFYVVISCEINLFKNYFRSLLQLMNTFPHVQCR